MKKEALHKNEEPNSSKEVYFLVLYNDEINTFDYVIKVLGLRCVDMIHARLNNVP